MSDDASRLCRSCALCCDGTLFSYVTLSAAEAEALRERDLALSARKDGSYRLPQRCRGLDGRDCTLYTSRPSPCRSYACLLAIALREGEINLQDARSVVAGAHQRLAALGEALGGADSPVPTLRASVRGDGAAASEVAQHLWQEVRDYLRRHFTGRHGMS